MAGDKQRQPAYNIYSIECRLYQSKFGPSGFKEAWARWCQKGYLSKKWLFICCWLVYRENGCR